MENRKAVIVSLLLAGLAVLFYFYYVDLKVKQEVGDLKEKVPIIMAKVDIPAGTKIDESMIDRFNFPKQYLPPRYATSPSEVLNQVAITSILRGEPVLKSKIIPFDESSLDRRIQSGKRAVTIGIRDSQDVIGVGGMLRPGHFVDILVTLFIDTKEVEKGGGGATALLAQQAQNLKAETRTILQSIKILAVGRDFALQAANVNREGGGIQENLTNKNVTVELSPQEVQELVLAQSIGRLTLSLRQFNDQEIVALDYADPFKTFKIKLPVVQGPEPAYREIRGGQVFASPY